MRIVHVDHKLPRVSRVISALDTPLVVSAVTTNPLIFKETVNTAIPFFSDTSRGPGFQLGSQTERSYISVLRPQIGS
ncbi:hypothetical protein ACN38_g1024 [Penicillium nordicum]|uniref:Transaldolase n=1 Tax=Penicillium nordicum TaxID=229535 RepID=A0A0M8P9K1_9EURO|nr:hypothetical protein ACN38_g1024 [Penicillium nordicum]